MLADLHSTISAVAPITGVEQHTDGTYGIQFMPEATEQQRSAAMAIASSWQEPAERRLVYSLDFLDRFPESTQLAVVAAAQQSPVIRLWYDRLIANGSVDLDSPRLRAGLQTMLAAGLLTQAEIDAALA